MDWHRGRTSADIEEEGSTRPGSLQAEPTLKAVAATDWERGLGGALRLLENVLVDSGDES